MLTSGTDLELQLPAVVAIALRYKDVHGLQQEASHQMIGCWPTTRLNSRHQRSAILQRQVHLSQGSR